MIDENRTNRTLAPAAPRISGVADRAVGHGLGVRRHRNLYEQEEREPPASKENRVRQGSHSSDTRILIVDDEPDLTTSLKRGLERGGAKIEICTDAAQAIHRFKDRRYDVVLLDMQTQVLDGFSISRELKLIKNDVRIGFLTTFPIYKQEFDKLFPNVGVDFFHPKSESITMLNTSIRSLMTGAS